MLSDVVCFNKGIIPYEGNNQYTLQAQFYLAISCIKDIWHPVRVNTLHLYILLFISTHCSTLVYVITKEVCIAYIQYILLFISIYYSSLVYTTLH